MNAADELVCTTETTLKPEQMLELYRYLKLTRMVEERLVNLYRQTKVVGGVFRSLGQEATAATCYALTAGFIRPSSDLGAVARQRHSPREFSRIHGEGVGPRRARPQPSLRRMAKGFIGPISHLCDMIPVRRQRARATDAK